MAAHGESTGAGDLDRRRARLLAGLLAVVAAVVVFLIATNVFPYHSTNHDEGVYLQQASMLLDGHLYLRPPVEGAFRPWFFVDAESPAGPAVPVTQQPGAVLYPKYAPVPAAIFAVGLSVGLPRLSLALVGGVVVGLTYAVVAEAFDRRHGVLAAGFVLGSPLFLVDAALFLPYAPTTVLNLAFAWAYLRADRLGRGGDSVDIDGTAHAGRARRWAIAAGLAVGAAFFARPYTALLFALPFVAHALWTLRGAVHSVGLAGDADAGGGGHGPDRATGWALDRRVLTRQGLVAAGGLVGVAVALGYNALVTGHALVFPYQAFAPADGLGFGHREILGYAREYTPALALRANAEVLWLLVTRWVVAGPLGSLLALVGLGAVLRGWRASDARSADPGNSRDADPRKLVLAGVVVSVAVGNVAFWGNLNVLGALSVAGDGLVSRLGPYYHFDLLLPVAAFGAHGLLLGVRRATDALADDEGRVGRVAVAALVVGAAVFGGVAAGVAADPIREDHAVGEQLTAAYQPFRTHDLDGAVVFLPDPYGPWLNHPFQALRNDPGFDGETVYALETRPFAVVDAFPDRTLYRYTYRGQWAPMAGDAVEPRLQRVRHVRGERVAIDATLGVPASATGVSMRLAGEDGAAYYVANGTPDSLPLTLVVEDGSARLTGPVSHAGGDAAVAVGDRTDLHLEVYVDTGGTTGFSYVLTVPVAREDGDVRALTPTVEVCDRPRLCGGEAAYVPGAVDPGVAANVSVRARG